MNELTQKVKVWDVFVRIGHWLLVAGFITAYLTGDEIMDVHIVAGYLVTAIVILRIIWGFIGSKHARFSDFIYRPSAIFGYLKNLINGRPQHFIGHNPAGGAMVIALLLSLAATTYSGLAVYAIEEHAGPLAQVYADNTQSISIISAAHASAMESNEGVDHDAEEFWEEIHEFFTNFTLLLVILHIGGVIASSHIDKERLIKAMITGEKEIEE